MDLLGPGMRHLAEDEEVPPEKWELIFMSVLIILMFTALITDRIAPDHTFVIAVAFCMVTGIVTIKEGLQGFANEGVLTVMVLFVVAHGLTMTGAVDWYVGKLLGNPKTCAGAQLRLIGSVSFLSAFLNNTPIVAVMIPIVMRWAKTIGVSASQLLIPLSYGAIIGGTCTLIGTSTNLVIAGLLEETYSIEINLFDVTPYGVPVAIMGVAYMMIFGPILLPGGQGGSGGSPLDGDEILLGARITSWSPAAGRSVKRSGLRDTGGVYLVSVRRAATGNIHRAVGQDFVLNVHDVVYFSGLIESFGEFCQEHGLEIITNESSEATVDSRIVNTFTSDTTPMNDDAAISLLNVPPGDDGNTNDSLLLSDEEEGLRIINLMSDTIQGLAPVESRSLLDKKPIVVTRDNRSHSRIVLIGVNTRDRPGLLLDISKCLLELKLQVHRTEAAVCDEQSVSVWRCSHMENEEFDAEQISAMLSMLLKDNSGVEVLKKGGLRVLRAKVTKNSRLVGRTAVEVKFRENYKAAIVAVQQGGKNAVQPLSSLKFRVGDILVLQVSDDCLLLSPPMTRGSSRRESISASITSLMGRSTKAQDEMKPPTNTIPEDVEVGTSDYNIASNSVKAEGNISDDATDAVWRDLIVLPAGMDSSSGSKEYLVAMRVSRKSVHTGKNIVGNGITKIPGVIVVSIERPIDHGRAQNVFVSSPRSDASFEDQLQNEGHAYNTIDPDEPLQDGDILWFAGDASSIGDLRKIPGLESPEVDQIKQMNENVHDRLLVQAVVAKSGPLVGKTVREIEFRTQYGAAVISVHREGRRIHEHPGNIKLHAGDVLLLEAGPTFIKRNANKDHAFALLAPVKDSAPPRLKFFMPAIVILLAMLIVSGFDLPTAPLLVCAVFASVVMVAIGLLSPQEARDAIDWSLYVAIACAFGISQALTNSGLAKVVANFLIIIGEGVGIGDAGLFGAVYFATALISSFVTNNAAATLMFPIALGAADTAGVDMKLMSYCLMLGASDFSTPFGYQTNLMVYGPGGYKTADYLKIGTPLQFILWLTSTWVLSTSSLWYVSLAVTTVVLVVVATVRLGGEGWRNRLKQGAGKNRHDS